MPGGLHSFFNDSFLKIAKEFGNGGYDLLFISGYGAFGLIKKDEYIKTTAFLAAKSFLAANSIGSILKYSTVRARPYVEEGKDKFTPFIFKTSRNSFPSRHTASAFSIATVFAERSNYLSIKIIAYSLATATAFERVYSDKHWASDVFSGAVIGYFIGKDIVLTEKNKSKNISLLPYPGGIILTSRF
ncbi:MAG: phosphatase PAP2 family protein [Elusimicrobiota bacterium]